MPKTEKKKTQSDKFKKTARDLECDESEERFDEALRRVGKQKKGKPAEGST